MASRVHQRGDVDLSYCSTHPLFSDFIAAMADVAVTTNAP
jgi:hypothetical protein